MSEAGNPFAPPQAEVADIAVAGPVRAGRGQRLLAVLVDTFIYGVLIWLGSKVLPINPFNASPSLLEVVANTAVGIVLFLALQAWPLAKRGQTLGKMALGVRIVRADGSRASLGRLLGLRYGVSLLIGLIRWWARLQPRRRAADLPRVAALPARPDRRHHRRARLNAAGHARQRRDAGGHHAVAAHGRRGAAHAGVPAGSADPLRPGDRRQHGAVAAAGLGVGAFLVAIFAIEWFYPVLSRPRAAPRRPASVRSACAS